LISSGKKRIDGSDEKVNQPPYSYGSAQVEVFLDVIETYYIVPSLLRRNQAGTFFLSVFADGSFQMDTSASLSLTEKPMCLGKDKGIEKKLDMTVSQFNEKKEILREFIVSETKRLKLSKLQVFSIFDDVKGQSFLKGQSGNKSYLD
jgi:hypothetical protein